MGDFSFGGRRAGESFHYIGGIYGGAGRRVCRVTVLTF